MVSIQDLHNDVVRQILQHCSQRVVHQVLKSKPYASLAYSVYYENVVLAPDHSDLPLNKIARNYVDTIEGRTYPPLPFENEPEENERIDSFKSFISARELIQFYRSHPLYQPNVLTYYRNADLALIEQLKPGLLTKFKYFRYLHNGLDQAVYDVVHLKHKVYTAPIILAGSYPEYIETLANPVDCPSIPMPSVKTLYPHELEFLFANFDNFPNLREISFTTKDLPRKIDMENLTTITITTGHADLSKLRNLKTAYLWFYYLHDVVGYKPDYEYQIPKNLQNLYLFNLGSSESLEIAGGVCLRTLSISCCPPAYVVEGTLKFRFPPNLTDLTITGKNRGYHKLKFPDSLQHLTINKAVKLEKFSFQPKISLDLSIPDTNEIQLTSLNLLESNIEDFPLTDFPYLTKLSFYNAFMGLTELPSSLEYLHYVDQYGFDPKTLNMNHLKYLRVDYLTSRQPKEFVVPPSVETLILRGRQECKLGGGENLTTLELIDYAGEPMEFSTFKRLRVLSLCNKTHQNTSLSSLPLRLEALILRGHFVRDFDIPTNLKYLELERCIIPKFKLKSCDSLEVITLDDVTVPFANLFKPMGKSLKVVDIKNCKLDDFKVDLRDTGLQYFSIDSSHYQGKKIKFPKCLTAFRMLDETNDHTKSSYLDWADFSKCKHITEFYCPNVVFSGAKNMSKLLKFNNQIIPEILQEI